MVASLCNTLKAFELYTLVVELYSMYISIKLLKRTAMRYHHYIPIRMNEIIEYDHTKCWSECGTTGTFIYCWNENWYNHFGNHCSSFLKSEMCNQHMIQP